MAPASLSSILALEGKAEDLLRRYDASEDLSEKQALREQLRVVRASLSSSAYMSGPSTGSSDFGCILSARPEFSRLGAPSPGPGDAQSCERSWFMLTPTQAFVKNFMAVHDALLLFHAVGTGKSCSAITTAEYLRDTGVFQKKTLVIVPLYLKTAFAKQVFNTDKLSGPEDDVGSQCTGDAYVRMVTADAGPGLSTDELSAKVAKLVRRRYEVMSYGEFAGVVRSKVAAIQHRFMDAESREDKTARAMQELVADRLIIMDEVHHIKVAATGEEDAKVVAPMIDLALKYAKNTKLLLMTATPMFDQAEEIVWLLNLMRRISGSSPLETEAVFAPDGQLKRGGAEVLRRAASGCVSYLDAENPWTYPLRLDSPDARVPAGVTQTMHGAPIPDGARLRDTKLVVSVMSADQQRAYDETLPKVLRMDTASARPMAARDDRVKSLTSLQQISNINWPSSGSAAIGKEGLRSCLSVVERKGRQRYAYQPRTIARWGRFLGASHLKQHAPKLHAIMEYIRTSTGVVYVYSQFLPGGLIPLALALEHAGVQPLRGDRLWGAADEGSVDARITANGKPASYLLLTGEHKHDPRDIEAARSLANASGEVVKVILCSAVGTEGVDLKHIREVHILEPWFNVSRVLQAYGRAVRRCSHFDLPPASRNVTIYRHAVMMGGAAKSESIDYHVYRDAENKHRVVQQVETILREQAVDCQLNISAGAPASERLTITTSQGVSIKDYPIFAVGQRSCAACPPSKSRKNHNLRDNLSAILDGTDEYTRLVVAPMFASRVHHTYDELATKGRAVFKARFDDDTLSACLQHMLVRQTTVPGPPASGEKGRIIYAGGEYVFQPQSTADASVPLSVREAPSSRALRVAVDIKSMKGGGRQSKGGVQDRVERLKAVIGSVWSGALEWIGSAPFVDFVVDRMPAAELESTVGQLSRAAHQGYPMSDFDMAVLASLCSAGIWECDAEGARRVFVSEKNAWMRVLPSGEVVPEAALAPRPPKASLNVITNHHQRRALQKHLRVELPSRAIDAGTLRAPTSHLAALYELCARSIFQGSAMGGQSSSLRARTILVR